MIKYRLISGLAVAGLLFLPGCPGGITEETQNSGPAPKEIASLAITPDQLVLYAPAKADPVALPGATPTPNPSPSPSYSPTPPPSPGSAIKEHAGLDSATYLTAIATLHDGTTQRVSGITWRSSHPSLIAVSEDGLAKALLAGTTGQVTITAIHREKPELSASAVITLVNEGGAAVEIE